MSAYGMIIDVKMLDFFRHIGTATLVFVAIISIMSLFIRNARCRYLCPYGALLGLFSLLSPFKIRRNADSCIDCGKCAKNCPSNIPVDKLIQVRTVECTGCMTCVESCPVASTLTFSLQRPTGNAAPKPWWQRVALRMGNDATAARYSICRHWLCDVCQRLADAGTGAYVFSVDTESQNDRALTFTALQTIKHPANSGRVSAFSTILRLMNLCHRRPVYTNLNSLWNNSIFISCSAIRDLNNARE